MPPADPTGLCLTLTAPGVWLYMTGYAELLSLGKASREMPCPGRKLPPKSSWEIEDVLRAVAPRAAQLGFHSLSTRVLLGLHRWL